MGITSKGMVRRGGLVLPPIIDATQVIHTTNAQKRQKFQKYAIKSHNESHDLS